MKYEGTYDIECGDWTNFKVGRWQSRDGKRSFVSRNESVFFKSLVSQKGAWYGHFGGRYDALWIADIATKLGMPWVAQMRGSGIMSLKIGDFEARDSYAIMPMKLADAAKMGGANKLETGFKCECGKACGGFCVLSRPMSASEWSDLEGYLEGDCNALVSALDAIDEMSELHSIHLGLTVGGSAWKTAQAWCGVQKTDHDVASYSAVRAGYYGGRTEVYRTWADSGKRYDIHSSYPAALTNTPTPVGKRRFIEGREAFNAFKAGKPGIYSATVKIKECFSPPLPLRTPERLYFPTGVFSGTWTGLELEHAVSTGLAQIVEIESGIVWLRTELVFAPYASRVWDIRAAYAADGTEKGKARAAWIKWLANSLTGRLAIRPEHDSLRFVPRGADGMIELDGDYDVLRDLPHGAFVSVPSCSIDGSAHVEAAAYLTAGARGPALHGQLLHAGENALYCDTDSVYATCELTRDIGDELGQWGFEGDMVNWECLAPKVYRYETKGKTKVKAKGMSDLDSPGFDSIKEGGEWRVNRGVESIKTAIRRKRDSLFERKDLARSLSPVEGWVGGRILLDNGRTRPPSANEAYAASMKSEESQARRWRDNE